MKPILLTIHALEKQIDESVNIRPTWYMQEKEPEMHHIGSGIFDGDDGNYYVYSGEKRNKFNNLESAELFAKSKQNKFQREVKEKHDELSEKYNYSDSDKATIGKYTSNLQDLNHKMNQGKNLTDEESDMINKLSGILNKNKTTEPMTVWTGVSYAHHNILKNAEEPIHHRAFISTSINPNIARGFAEKKKGHIVELEVPTGTPSAYVSHVSEHDGERELILPRGMKIEIDHSQRKVLVHDSGKFIVHKGKIVPSD